MNGRAEVSRLQKRLDATLTRAPHPTTDVEFQSDFAKYFCVLVLGFFENAIVALVLDFAQKRSAQEVSLYVERELDYWTNPNCEKIIQLLGGFKPSWREAMDKYLADDKRKSAVNSLVALRHKIAHGESVGTSLHQVKEYYKIVLEVLKYIADLLDPVESN